MTCDDLDLFTLFHFHIILIFQNFMQCDCLTILKMQIVATSK